MNTVLEFRQVLKPGAVYRREDLESLASGDTDYLLKKLCKANALKKVQNGLYYCPVFTDFGEKFPNERLLLKSFLKSNRFLCVSPNDYNSLGLGTTQLYNMTYVYNGKRNGLFEFLGRKYRFFKKFDFPSRVTREFLVVDMINNLKLLAEDEEKVKQTFSEGVSNFDAKALCAMAERYGKVGTRKFIQGLLNVSA
jgi:hypothetical protein